MNPADEPVTCLRACLHLHGTPLSAQRAADPISNDPDRSVSDSAWPVTSISEPDTDSRQLAQGHTA